MKYLQLPGSKQAYVIEHVRDSIYEITHLVPAPRVFELTIIDGTLYDRKHYQCSHLYLNYYINIDSLLICSLRIENGKPVWKHCPRLRLKDGCIHGGSDLVHVRPMVENAQLHIHTSFTPVRGHRES